METSQWILVLLSLKEKKHFQKGLMNEVVAENFFIFLYQQNSISNNQIILPLLQFLPQKFIIVAIFTEHCQSLY